MFFLQLRKPVLFLSITSHELLATARIDFRSLRKSSLAFSPNYRHDVLISAECLLPDNRACCSCQSGASSRYPSGSPSTGEWKHPANVRVERQTESTQSRSIPAPRVTELAFPATGIRSPSVLVSSAPTPPKVVSLLEPLVGAIPRSSHSLHIFESSIYLSSASIAACEVLLGHGVEFFLPCR